MPLFFEQISRYIKWGIEKYACVEDLIVFLIGHIGRTTD